MIEKSFWGKLADGRTVHLYTITRGTAVLTASDFGCIITSLTVPDRDGKPGDIVLGYDSLEEYIRDDAFMGAVIGRYANRIEEAAFSLGGTHYQLTINEGSNTLHGGAGFHKRLWEAETSEYSVTFRRTSPDREDGFPGNLDVAVRYELLSDGSLAMIFEAESDRDTVLCLTNHSYFNLNGGGPITGHYLWMNAEHYTPVDERKIPTGEIVSTAGTIYDFSTMRLIGTATYDHNFVLSKREGRKAALYAPQSGRRMTLLTDMPGMQLYTGCSLTPRYGKNGALCSPGMSVCMETQQFPDSPNKHQFPSSVLKGGQRFRSQTVFCFDTVDR